MQALLLEFFGGASCTINIIIVIIIIIHYIHSAPSYGVIKCENVPGWCSRRRMRRRRRGPAVGGTLVIRIRIVQSRVDAELHLVISFVIGAETKRNRTGACP